MKQVMVLAYGKDSIDPSDLKLIEEKLTELGITLVKVPFKTGTAMIEPYWRLEIISREKK